MDAANKEKWEEVDLEKNQRIVADGVCVTEQIVKLNKEQEEHMPRPSPQKVMESEKKAHKKTVPHTPEPKQQPEPTGMH